MASKIENEWRAVLCSSKPKVWCYHVVVLWSTAKKYTEMRATRAAQFLLCDVAVAVAVLNSLIIRTSHSRKF